MKDPCYSILDIDPILQPFAKDIHLRMEGYKAMKKKILNGKGKLSDFANGHLYFGFHRAEGGWIYREWAPAACEISLFGDFNGWNRDEYKLTPLGNGCFEIFIPGEMPHGSQVRIRIRTAHGEWERIPLYCKCLYQNTDTKAFNGLIWNPSQPYAWKNGDFSTDSVKPLLIYESHVGMAGEEPAVSTFHYFRESILPRIKELGYNAVQLMAIMEHPYYGSFGYQVSNFFAVSSRFGTPEELKALIDEAHGMGLAVLLDLVHSHAASNTEEGLAAFDGTAYQFFHTGSRGKHPAWGTCLFHYSKPEVVHFLLSNLKFWLSEYHFDGFRFDGVTSMLYHDHGLGEAFDNYAKYFSLNTDTEAINYLQLATDLCKEVKPDSVLIAEDMSGMPGMCLPVKAGGIGFDYRLSMGVPDFWIKSLKTLQDEDWHMGHMFYELTQRRPMEKVIGYCESHDQALVGDKTIIFWLADKEMYWHMDKASESLAIDRAMSLHKMIRLITCVCAGEGYLNFMGNEFGHPEWIDFPREGNNWSYHYARRRWSLANDPSLRYGLLENFDKAMISLVKTENLLEKPSILAYIHEHNKIVAFFKGNYLFAFNFHPTNDGMVKIAAASSTWKTVLRSEWQEFGGYREREAEIIAPQVKNGESYMEISLHKRTALVLQMV